MPYGFCARMSRDAVRSVVRHDAATAGKRKDLPLVSQKSPLARRHRCVQSATQTRISAGRRVQARMGDDR